MKKLFIVFFFLIFALQLVAQDEEKFGISIGGGLSFPLGNFGDVYKTGVSGEFLFSYDLEWNTNVYVAVGYTRWNLNLDKFNNQFGGSGRYDITAPVSAMPALVGIRWFWEHEKYAPYFLIEGGIYNYNVEISGTLTKNGNVSVIRPRTENFSETTFNIGLGGIWRLNEDIDLDIKARYHFVSSEKVYYYSDIGYDATVNTNKFISVLAGVQFKF